MKIASLVLALVCAVLLPGASYAAQPKAKHPAARILVPSTVRNTKVIHPPGPVKSGIAPQGSLQRQPLISNSTSLPRIIVRHRGSNPAAVGGAATSNAKNTGAVNGTQIIRRHY